MHSYCAAGAGLDSRRVHHQEGLNNRPPFSCASCIAASPAVGHPATNRSRRLARNAAARGRLSAPPRRSAIRGTAPSANTGATAPASVMVRRDRAHAATDSACVALFLHRRRSLVSRQALTYVARRQAGRASDAERAQPLPGDPGTGSFAGQSATSHDTAHMVFSDWAGRYRLRPIMTSWTAASVAMLALVSPLAVAADTIRGAGSSAAAPIYKRWAQEYQKATGIELAYEPIGSSAGLK